MADFLFNELLERRGLNPLNTRLLRHDNRGAYAWRRGGPNKFGCFASFQRAHPMPYRGAELACHFLAGPPLPDGQASALFIGATVILDSWVWNGERPPRIQDEEMIAQEPPRADILAFDLDWLPQTEDLSERILIRWGINTRTWSQWAHRGLKEIVELRQVPHELPFPGFSDFRIRISEVGTLPQSWHGALASVRGVYLLVAENGEQYVGSATGQDGFIGRWRQYAANGHGGNVLLRGAGFRDYDASILEVASPDMSPQDIVGREGRWKEKLGVRAHGLNAN